MGHTENEIARLPGDLQRKDPDVVKVVRCKDCKHHYDLDVHYCYRLCIECPDDADFFCGYGEREETDGKQ